LLHNSFAVSPYLRWLVSHFLFLFPLIFLYLWKTCNPIIRIFRHKSIIS
jgi:hypothetical protein